MYDLFAIIFGSSWLRQGSNYYNLIRGRWGRVSSYWNSQIVKIVEKR